MKKNIIYTLLGVALCTTIASCLPEKAETALIYKGATKIEFKNQDLGQIDTVLNRKGVYTCTTQTDTTRSVNQDAIAYKATAATPNTLSCVAVGGTTYRLTANTALAANARITDSILVQLVGPQRSTPTSIAYTVRPSTAASNPTTAVEGTHYDFRTPGARTVTIPANRSSAYILVDIKPGGLTVAGSSVRLTLDLVGAADADPSPNYSKFSVTIRKN